MCRGPVFLSWPEPDCGLSFGLPGVHEVRESLLEVCPVLLFHLLVPVVFDGEPVCSPCHFYECILSCVHFFVVFFCCRENKLSVRGPKKSAAGPRVSPCGGRGVSCVVAFSGQYFKELRPALAVPGVALRGPGPVAFLLCIVAGAFPLSPSVLAAGFRPDRQPFNSTNIQKYFD